MKRIFVVYGVTVAGMALLYGFMMTMGYRINQSDSIPPGLYQVSSVGRPIQKGDIVWFCPPDTPDFRYGRDVLNCIPPGNCPGNYLHMLKPVVAVAGDQVEVKTNGVYVNGHLVVNSKPLTRDNQGHPLKPSLGSFNVPSGRVWLVSHFNPRSFDSRYFGPVSTGQIEGLARPVWVKKY